MISSIFRGEYLVLKKGHILSIFVAALLLAAPDSGRAAANASQVDRRSYDLGAIAAFAEMVHVGVKRLGFSSALSPADANALWEEAKKIASENHVALYREPDLLVTDLFPADVAKGKDVLLIYKGSTLDEYLALKRKKAQLVKSGTYGGKAREEIARQLGMLLSYPESSIDDLLKKNMVRE
jgi:hypothetical protein